MMNVNAVYAEKCVTPDEAVTLITSGSHLSMGMFAAEPPALLNALAKRAKRGEINDLRVYCYETASIAGNTIFRYELSDYPVRIRSWGCYRPLKAGNNTRNRIIRGR